MKPSSSAASSAASSLAAFTALLSLASSTSWAADRTLPPVPGDVPAFTMPVPAEFNLKNGLKVFFIERHRAPLVDVVVSVGGGGLADPAGKEGVAVAVADLLTQGSKNAAGDVKDAFAFDDAVQSLGASIDAAASWTSMSLSLHIASSRLKEGLALFSDALLRPTFTDDDWDRKRGEKMGELAYYKDDARTLVGLAAARTLFGGARPGTAMLGTPKSLTTVTAQDLRAFHTAQVRPDNAFVVVVGDIDRATLVSALEQAFSSWQAPAEKLAPAPRPEPAPLTDRCVVIVDRPAAPQSAVQVVSTLPLSLQPLDAPTAVMQTLLGGSFTSRLNNNLREEHGYSYGASYSVSTRPWHRASVNTSVASPVTLPALQEIMNELERIRTPATVEEIERARSYEALSFPAVLDGGRSLAFTWASWKEQELQSVAIAGYMKSVLQVDVAAAQKAAQSLVDPTKLVVVIVGDREKLKEGLAKFGTLSSLTAEELLPAPAASPAR